MLPILTVLLRALVAPILLIATVILSFFAALGTGIFFFDHVFGFPGVDPSLPLLAFVFLVALGIDYNIFLMTRVREETLRHGTRVGTRRGLAVTGAVITSAGIVLAGTFRARRAAAHTSSPTSASSSRSASCSTPSSSGRSSSRRSRWTSAGRCGGRRACSTRITSSRRTRSARGWRPA